MPRLFTILCVHTEEASREPWPSAPTYRLWIVPVLLVSAVLGSCGPARDPLPNALPTNGVVSEQPVLCGMSRDWSVSEDESGWEFTGRAEIPCRVGRRPPEDLAFRFVPGPGTEEHHYRLLWNDEELWRGSPSANADVEVDVPSSRLVPGSHRLTVQRIRRRGSDGGPSGRFDRVEMRTVGDSSRVTAFAPGRIDDLRYLADFLLYGSTGSDRLKTTGVLVHGPGSLRLEIPEARSLRLRLRPENESAEPADFEVQVDGQVHRTTVKPGGRQAMGVPLPDGATEIHLEVEGVEDGLFLLGAPRLVPDRRPESLPPVVLVTLDTTRRDALGAYGAPAGATPNLDRFADTATVYDLALSTSPWTLPSHVSIFTGLYPSRHGTGLTESRMPEHLPNLARLLREGGYRPVGLAGGVMMSHGFGPGRDFSFYVDPEKGSTRGDRLTDDALELLDAIEAETPFLFVNYFDPHAPYDAPAPFPGRFGVDRARERLREPVWKLTARGDGGQWRRLVQGGGPLTEAGLEWLRAAYRAEVGFMDREVARLFAGLRDRGLWDDALVVVVSDHGELLGEGGFLSHGYRLDPELVEVPLLIKEPGQRRGRRTDALVTVADLFPTILSVAGLPAPASDGLRIGSRKSGELGHRYVLYEEHWGVTHPLNQPHRRIADHLWGIQARGRRQIAWEGGSECARRGPGAHWVSEACPAEPAWMLSFVTDLLGPPPEAGDRPASEVTEDQRSAMRALGYL